MVKNKTCEDIEEVSQQRISRWVLTITHQQNSLELHNVSEIGLSSPHVASSMPASTLKFTYRV